MKLKKLPIITIDGPAGVGKTSIAQALAKKLRLPCLDTGGMFRFAALKLGADGLSWPKEKLVRELGNIHFNMKGSGSESILVCNGEAAGSQLRAEEISALASQLAQIPEVREKMRCAQQKIGAGRALIAEGRDMGTVVFPEAAVKFFMDADSEIRATRRFLQLREKGETPDPAELAKNMRIRDERDRNRATAPLKPAEDAIIIDTSRLDLPAVLDRILAIVHESGAFPE